MNLLQFFGGINSNSSDESTKSNASDVSEIKSTNNSISAKRGSENIGIAVFKDDKLIGELTALETLCLSIIKEEVDSFLISIPSPMNQQEKIDLMIYSDDNNKIEVDIVNNTPYISLDFNFAGRIYSMKDNSKYLDSSVLDSISKQANNYLEDIITQYLYKTSIEFKSDINDIGKYCLSNFLTIPEFKKFDWKNNYANSAFNVSVNTEIQSGFLITET